MIAGKVGITLRVMKIDWDTSLVVSLALSGYESSRFLFLTRSVRTTMRLPAFLRITSSP